MKETNKYIKSLRTELNTQESDINELLPRKVTIIKMEPGMGKCKVNIAEQMKTYLSKLKSGVPQTYF